MIRYTPSPIYFLRANLVTLSLLPLLLAVYQYLTQNGDKIAVWGVLLLSVALLILLVYHCLYLRSCSWTLTEEQLVFQRGIIAIDKDYLELYRVSDFGECSSVLDRIFGIKRINITSTDQSTPTLLIYGIPSSVDLLTPLRENVERCKKQKRIYEMANF